MTSDDPDVRVVSFDSKRQKRKRARSRTTRHGRSMRARDTLKPLSVLANALVALRAEMPNTFAFDEMLWRRY